MTTSVEGVTSTIGFSAEDYRRQEEILRLEIEAADSVGAAVDYIGTSRIKDELSYILELAEDEKIIGVDALNGPRNMAVSCTTQSEKEGLVTHWRFIDGDYRPGKEGEPRFSEPFISLLGKQALSNAGESRPVPAGQKHSLLFRLAASEIHLA